MNHPRMSTLTDTLVLLIPLSMMTLYNQHYPKPVTPGSHYTGALFHIAKDEHLHRHTGVVLTPVHGAVLLKREKSNG
jgi:hypothetical protein